MENQTEKKGKWSLEKSLLIVVIALVLVLGSLAAVLLWSPSGNKVVALVSVKINPSIVFGVDKNDDILEIAYADPIAEDLLEDEDIIGENVYDVIETFTTLADEAGFLGEDKPNDIKIIRFTDKKIPDDYFDSIQDNLEDELGYAVDLDRESGSMEEGRAFVMFKEEQPAVDASTDNNDQSTPSPDAEATTEPSIEPTVVPLPTPTPTAAPVLPTPNSIGTGDVLFNINVNTTMADIDGDGVDEEITFVAGEANSTLTVDGVNYTINQSNLAQKFAIADVDVDDDYIEIVFCDAYHTPDHDLDLPNSHFYWFDGTTFVHCGTFWDMGWDGVWLDDFDINEHMDGHGTIMCMERAMEFTDAWYIAHWGLTGANRQKEEILYVTEPLYNISALTLKEPCLLLNNIGMQYFDASHNSMWDHASWPHVMGRVIDPDSSGTIAIIAQPTETLQITHMYGKRWFKLETADGYSGWVRIVNFEMSGYDDVMHIDAWDIFDNIQIAG